MSTPVTTASVAAISHRALGGAGAEQDDERSDHRDERGIRSEHHHARGTEHRIHHQRHDGRVEAVDRRQTGRLRVAHPDRHQEAGEDHAGETSDRSRTPFVRPRVVTPGNQSFTRAP